MSKVSAVIYCRSWVDPPFFSFVNNYRTPEKKSEDVLQALELPHQVNTLAAGGGPGQALQELQRKGLCARKMAAWVQSARMDAILGGLQQTTMASLRSGLRCYIAFVGGIICFFMCTCLLC